MNIISYSLHLALQCRFLFQDGLPSRLLPILQVAFDFDQVVGIFFSLSEEVVSEHEIEFSQDIHSIPFSSIRSPFELY